MKSTAHLVDGVEYVHIVLCIARNDARVDFRLWDEILLTVLFEWLERGRRNGGKGGVPQGGPGRPEEARPREIGRESESCGPRLKSALPRRYGSAAAESRKSNVSSLCCGKWLVLPCPEPVT